MAAVDPTLDSVHYFEVCVDHVRFVWFRRAFAERVVQTTARKPPVDIRRTSIIERHKKFRLVAICILIAVCVWKITDAAVQLLAKPPWVAVATAIIAALGSGLVQVPILWRVRIRVRKFTTEVISRNRMLEELINPDRSSSDLMPDGTDPPGDEPWDRPSN